MSRVAGGGAGLRPRGAPFPLGFVLCCLCTHSAPFRELYLENGEDKLEHFQESERGKNFQSRRVLHKAAVTRCRGAAVEELVGPVGVSLPSCLGAGVADFGLTHRIT